MSNKKEKANSKEPLWLVILLTPIDFIANNMVASFLIFLVLSSIATSIYSHEQKQKKHGDPYYLIADQVKQTALVVAAHDRMAQKSPASSGTNNWFIDRNSVVKTVMPSLLSSKNWGGSLVLNDQKDSSKQLSLTRARELDDNSDIYLELDFKAGSYYLKSTSMKNPICYQPGISGSTPLVNRDLWISGTAESIGVKVSSNSIQFGNACEIKVYVHLKEMHS